MTIQEIYGRPSVVGFKSKRGSVRTMPIPDWLVGLELEIEEFNPDVDRIFPGFVFTDDGSLRSTNGGIGIEAITKPVSIQFVPGMLEGFFEQFEISHGNYSERCSTHVHFNVEPLEFYQVSTICLVYQAVEQLLFKFIGNDRENNIFCVPWNQCNLSYNIVGDIDGGLAGLRFKKWQKYSALNLIPITHQGTIEFRHLEGTCDVKRIMNWIALISKIFEYAMRVPLEDAKKEIVFMNTVSNYHQWMSNIFGDYLHLIQVPGYERVLAKGVIDCKLMLSKGKMKSLEETIRQLRNEEDSEESSDSIVWGIQDDEVPF